MDDPINSCNFLAGDVLEASSPYWSYTMVPGRIRKRLIDIKQSLLSKIIRPDQSSVSPVNNSLNLQPGEWIQVKSIDEIFRTLDEKKRYRGLYFMPEMQNFCGKKFRVFKKVERIKLETTGEIRKLKTPTVFLEGVYCNGDIHDGCDRACFHFWKEVWLTRTS